MTVTLLILLKEFFVRVLAKFLVFKSIYSNLIVSKIDSIIAVEFSAQWHNIYAAS